MKKLLTTVAGAILLGILMMSPLQSVAQVNGEFNSISIVDGKPYQELDPATASEVPPSAWGLPPSYSPTNIDDGYFRVDIGFDFEFNGEIFNELWICTNGFVTFTEPPFLSNPDNNALFLDANNYPVNVVAPFWGDHHFIDENLFFLEGFVISSVLYEQGQVEIEENVFQKYFVVEWKNLNINNPNLDPALKASVGNFQIWLWESTDAFSRQGDVEFAYGTVGPPENRDDITETEVITRGAVVGVKGEGKIVGEGADYLNGMIIGDLDEAAESERKTLFWPPSGGTDKRILFSAIARENVAEWWGDGDVDFSKSFGRKHFGLPQSRFVTVNDARLILKSVASGIPLDPVRRRAAYHGDVNHNGRYYYNNLNEKINIYKKSKVFTDDLPDEISSVKQVLFEANEVDAAWILKYIGGRVVELPWLLDTSVAYGKLNPAENADAITVGNVDKINETEYIVNIHVNNDLEGILAAKFDISGTITDVIRYQEENNYMVTTHGGRVVIAGDGSFNAKEPVIALRVSGVENIEIRDIRFNEKDVEDIVINSIETSEVNNVVVKTTPNPFTENTTFIVNIENEGDYNLTVFNLQGVKVAELVNGVLEVGVKTFVWDGRDNAGAKVPAGVYIYKLQNANETITDKVVVER